MEKVRRGEGMGRLMLCIREEKKANSGGMLHNRVTIVGAAFLKRTRNDKNVVSRKK